MTISKGPSSVKNKQDDKENQQLGEAGSSYSDLSRRDFIGGTGAAALVVANSSPLKAQEVTDREVLEPEVTDVPKTAITITVNGRLHQIEVEDRWTLIELLRDHLELTGSKIGCNRGECGSCTVLVDGEPVYSCSTLAVWADGQDVLTVEGLEKDGKLSVLQQAFMEHNAPQCGFCTSGQLMSATALLEENPEPTVDEVRHALAGNLCRCSNYNAIVEAVMDASRTGGA